MNLKRICPLPLRPSRALAVLALAALLCSAFPGCALVRSGVRRSARDLASGLMREDDFDLAREGAPAFLLALDAMAAAHPDDPYALATAADAQLAYATAFVGTDPARAKRMYAKARRLALDSLSLRNRDFAATLGGTDQDAFERSLAGFGAADAQTLFTAASSWMLWIVASSDSPAALGGLPRALAMVKRTHDLDPSIRNGGPDLFYGIYYTVLPLGAGRDLDKARSHFERSMALAGPDYLPARVAFAEYYARYAFNQPLFEETLRAVLDAPPPSPDPNALANEAARRRARNLLARTDDLF